MLRRRLRRVRLWNVVRVIAEEVEEAAAKRPIVKVEAAE